MAETWHTHFLRADLAAREAAAWKAAQHQRLATLIPYLPELRGGKQQHFSDLLGFGWEKLGAQLPTVQEVCVVGYAGEGFYPRPSESPLFFLQWKRRTEVFPLHYSSALPPGASPWGEGEKHMQG